WGGSSRAGFGSRTMITGMPAGGAGTLPATLVPEDGCPRGAGSAAAAGASVSGFEQPARNGTQLLNAYRTSPIHRYVTSRSYDLSSAMVSDAARHSPLRQD